MGRPKNYDVDLVIEAINKYFFIENYGNPKELKRTRIARYLNKNGFPNITDRHINRDAILVDHIKILENTDINDSTGIMLSYTPLIVEDFLKTNNNIEKLRKALTILDNHYERIYEFALIKNKEAKEANQISADYLETNRKLLANIEEKNSQISLLKSVIKELESEKKLYRNYINETMLPEIANEILREDRVLFDGPKMIQDVGLNEMIIDDTKPMDKVISEIDKKEKRFRNKTIQRKYESLEKDN